MVRAFIAALALAAGCTQTGREPQKAEPLPPAGSPRDDGSGLLARLSAPPVPSDEAPIALDAGVPAGDGGAADSSVPFADYHFVPRASYRPTPPPYEDGYTAETIRASGTIAGVVRGGRRAGCGGPAAVVYLADIERGRAFLGLSSATLYQRRLQIGGLVEHRDCGLSPRLQVAEPVGAVLEVVQGRAGALEVVAARGGEEVFSQRLAGAGARTSLLLDAPGPLELRAGDARAWVLVAGHPYHAVTDERGRFALTEVPPGRYVLVVWHLRGDQPATVRRSVTVRAGETASVRVDLR